MSNDLVPVKPTQNAVQFYSIRNMNYDAIEKKMDEESAGSRFPGDALTHDGKRGKWRWGFGKNAVPFDHTAVSFVFNVPGAVEFWQKFVDNRPVFGPMVMICSNDKLPDRETLGDNDDRLWPRDDRGNPQDPWKRCVACPVRYDGDTRVNHLALSGFWSVVKFKDFVKKFAQDGRRNPGMLPVVNLGTEVKQRKDKPSETFDIPVFTIVAWDAPLACDEPAPGEQAGVEAEAGQLAIPETSVQTVQRSADGQGHVGMNNPAQSTVDKLQEKANASAAAEAQRTTQQVQSIAQQAGAAPARRREAPQSGTGQATPAPANAGLFAGRGARRPVNA